MNIDHAAERAGVSIAPVSRVLDGEYAAPNAYCVTRRTDSPYGSHRRSAGRRHTLIRCLCRSLEKA